MNLKEMIEQAGYETMSYSGRMMFGKTCLAVRIDDSSFLYFAGKVIQRLTDIEDAKSFGFNIGTARTDTLGMDKVLYFPFVEYEN